MDRATDIQHGQGDRRPRRPKLWSWLRSVLLSANRDPGCAGEGRDTAAIATRLWLVPEVSGDAVADHSASAQLERSATGVILPFPIHGEALLVKLAEGLRSRVADRGSEAEPLLLQLSRRPRSRLSIDCKAYIEFEPDRLEYRAVIEASHETRVILETGDFDALVEFVLQYVEGRLNQPAALEAAS
jgi:hypothetical protein